MPNSPSLPCSLPCVLLAAMLLMVSPGRATIVQITSSAGDLEVRQPSAAATFGQYTLGQGTVDGLRVGFQSNFGSDGASAGGIATLWFFQLPVLQAGESIRGTDFVTTLLEETATSPITPRFNADLYALGFISSPSLIAANATTFFAGQLQTGAGLGANQQIQRIDDDYFVVFQDFQDVNNPTPKKPKSLSIDDAGRLSLTAYLQGIYGNPAFPNDGSQFLVLRMNPDRQAAETYQENGTQPYAKGITRYRVAASEASALTGTVNGVDYSDVTPPRLTLDIIPEPGAISLFALAGLWLAARRRRVA